MTEVVEGQQPVVEGKYAIGQSQIVVGALRQALELPNHVVGKIADTAGDERRQVRQSGRTILPQTGTQQVNHVALSPLHRTVRANSEVLTASCNDGAGVCAQEGVAPNLLAALNRLEKKCVFLPGGEA